MKTKQIEPWRDNRGRELPKEKLKEISKTWSLDTWAKYSESLELEREGKNISEDELRICEEQITESFFGNLPSGSKNPELRKKIFKAMKILSKRQRQVIESIFYCGKSEVETAANFGISQQTVNEYKQIALFKLKKILSRDPVVFGTYGGASDLEQQNDLHDVMNAEISRTECSRTRVEED